MDRSMDSIGSCSLDVDAESSDISDTSGSLNFPTPISIKDITREFTNNIRERCSLQTVKNTTAYVDPVTGQVCIALTQPTTTIAAVNNNVNNVIVDSHNQTSSTTTTTLLTPQTPEDNYDKKPSYLNLACCVNGYSNITTYDSKIRQDINKSREVSPIRPSSTSLQYCKKGNSLAPPVLLAMPNVNLKSPQQQQPTPYQMANTNGVYVTSGTIGSKYSIVENNNHSQNGLDCHNTSDEGGGSGRRSFIQQRVERLYGPGALAQGFYSPKKIKDFSTRLNKTDVSENGGSEATTELARKFQELSPCKDYNQFRKKLSTNGRPPIPPSNVNAPKEDTTKLDNNNIDLPCLRHLSQEFRAQLPVVSPKRNFSRTSPSRDTIQPQTHKTVITNGTTVAHTMTTTPPLSTGITTNIINTTTTTTTTSTKQNHNPSSESSSEPSLSILKTSSPVTTGADELDHKVVVSNEAPLEKLVPALEEPKVVLPITVENTQPLSTAAISTTNATTNGSVTVAAKPMVKDAHFFLKQLKDEQNRLLIMAAEVEKYLEALASNPDINEDILGLLRSASGKARLLVSQKMKQFEGLCHNNLNSSPEDQFPTTVDDLQGFWDMVYLQVDHVDSIFAEIESLKKNDWKRPVEIMTTTVNVLKTPRGNKTSLISKSKPSTPVTNGAGSTTTTATPSAAALKREAQRKKLQEMKRRNREAMAAASASSTTSESSTIELVGINKIATASATTVGNEEDS